MVPLALADVVPLLLADADEPAVCGNMVLVIGPKAVTEEIDIGVRPSSMQVVQ